jgi:hypothetical protein
MNKKEFPKGLRPLDIFISSIDKQRHVSNIEGVAGVIHNGSTPNGRIIEIAVGLISDDTKDYRLLRDEAFSFFADDYFYISESFQRGKRYKVSVVESFTPTRLNQRMASMRFMLEMTDLPYAESIGTTQDIQQNGITADSELWGYGMGLLAEDNSLVYTHNVSGGQQFAVYNAGNVAIHPFQQELNIKIHNVVGSTSFLELRNDTTGNTFRVNEGVSSTIMLDGPNITSNGLQFLRKTNKQFIQLAPGWNYFTLTGATSATVEYDFRFCYE